MPTTRHPTPATTRCTHMDYGTARLGLAHVRRCDTRLRRVCGKRGRVAAVRRR